MDAMTIAQNSSPTTIGELREYLDAIESAWTDMDDEYLGQFNDQPLCQVAYGRGVSKGEAQFLGEFGLVIQEDAKHRRLVAHKYM